MKPCKDSEHTLEVISNHSLGDFSDEVVRWCSYCGVIVVDREYDCRTEPGGFMQMKFPKILKENN